MWNTKEKAKQNKTAYKSLLSGQFQTEKCESVPTKINIQQMAKLTEVKTFRYFSLFHIVNK